MDTTYSVTNISFTQDQRNVLVTCEPRINLTVSMDDFLELKPAKGEILSSERFTELVARNIQHYAYRKALEQISRRILSTFQVKQLIEKYAKISINALSKDISESIDAKLTVNRTLERIKALNILDDYNYAEHIVEGKKDQKSKAELKLILMRKRISPEIITKVIDAIEVDEEPAIKALIEKKLRLLNTSKLSKKEINAKISQALLRKGFKFYQFKNFLNNE